MRIFAEEFSKTFSGPLGVLAGMYVMTQTGIPDIQFSDKEDRDGSRKLFIYHFHLLWLTA